MIVQLGWRVILPVSLCALLTVQAANAEQQFEPSQNPFLNRSPTHLEEQFQLTAPLNAVPGISSSDGLNSVSADLPIKYWGNSFSLKFHRPSCPFAKAMSAHHVMFFNFRRQAIDSGQVPCRYCLPPNWTTVRASLWHPAELSKKDLPALESASKSTDAPAISPQLPK
ncbi:MAG: hypothetical protein JST89_02790 [Cyanobacteria bacterium SZAS-4]|nr:hypothetical protein [Cyanobacteria bacterium SZAS-4]